MIGYVEYPVTPDEPKRKAYATYYHCVWGWGGLANGYYQYYNGLGESVSELDPGNPVYHAPAYKNLNIVHGYKPNK